MNAYPTENKTDENIIKQMLHKNQYTEQIFTAVTDIQPSL
jgi:hypothetical protein